MSSLPMDSQPVRLYFSVEPEFNYLVEELQASMLRLAPSLPLEFLTGEDLNLEETAFQWMDWVVVLYSEGYMSWYRTQVELEQLKREKRLRPAHFFVAVLRLEPSLLPSELKGFPLFPEKGMGILGPQEERQIRLSALSLLNLFQKPLLQSSYQQRIPLFLEDLKERLERLEQRVDQQELLELIRLLVTDEPLSRAIRQLQDEYGRLGYSVESSADFFRKRKDLRTRVHRLLQELDQEGKMRPDWRPAFLANYQQLPLDRRPFFFLPNEEAGLPQHKVESGVAVSLEELSEFHRLMLLARDAFLLENVAAAWHHAEQIRTRIDPQSAQLYELLLLSFLKREGTEAIMRRWLEGTPSGLNHIRLYLDRMLAYQLQIPPQCPTETGEFNQASVVEALAASLQDLYNALPFDAILQTGLLEPATEAYRPLLLRSMEALYKLNNRLHPMAVFGDSLILEFCGAGKLVWLERLEIKDQQAQLICNSDFDLGGKISDLLDLLVEANPRQTPEKQRELLREDLFWRLLLRCEQLNQQVQEEARQYQQKTDVRRSVMRILQACLAGHAFLTRPGDPIDPEKSLPRLGIELLLPNLLLTEGKFQLPDSLLLPWFELEDQGNLVALNTGSANRDLDALALLQKWVMDLFGADHWTTMQENIRREVWVQQVAALEADWEELEKSRTYTDVRRPLPLELRRRMATCFKAWKRIYQAYPDPKLAFPDRVLEELAGERQLLWLELTPFSVQNLEENSLFDLDALSEIQYWLPFSSNWTEERLSAALISNLVSRSLIPQYEQLAAGAERERGTLAVLLGSLLRAFQIHSDLRYLDLVYEELTLDRVLKWIEIDKYGNWLNYSVELDAIGILEQMMQLFPQRYPEWDTRQRIADTRWKEQLERYEREISTLSSENQLEERRIAAEIIWRLKGVFLFHRDKKYLELPLQELMNEGRIRWYHLAFGLVKTSSNHLDNLKIGFDVKAERIELKNYWDQPLGT